MLTCTLTGSHGRLLMKKNCLSVALLPTPWSPRDTKPVILPTQISLLETTYFIEDFPQNGMVTLTETAVWEDQHHRVHILQ